MAKIAIVDDDVVYCKVLEKGFFKYHPFAEILTYNSGMDFIDNMPEDLDIVVLDYYLGDTLGIHILKEIKKRSPRTEVIISTTEDDRITTQEMMAAGAIDFINKADVGYREFLALRRSLNFILYTNKIRRELEEKIAELKK